MKKVLLVDDQDLIRAMLRWNLRNDFNLIEACDGEEAIRQIIAFNPDAVILDIRMPGKVDGYEVCKWIKDSSIHSTIYVILVTADWSLIEDMVGTLTADDYLIKPFDPKEVKAKLLSRLNWVIDIQKGD
jgi:two-component system alkaline phosphatase synthesis response regulator PhoP